MHPNFKKISIISIITFIGMILMQAFWIMDSYHERRAHFMEHINYVLDQVSQDYSHNNTDDNNTNLQGDYQGIKSLLQSKFSEIEDQPNYELFILEDGRYYPDSNTNSFESNESDNLVFTKNLDSHSNKKIILKIKDNRFYFLGSILGWIIISSLLVFIGIIALFINISLIHRQKKIGRIQSDFISNMTHELKTPIATISVASEMLMKDKVLSDKTKSKRYSTIINEENNRLKKLVERVMQIALFENGTMRIKLKEVDIHKTIQDSSDAISMIIEKRKGSISLDLKANPSIYKIDPTHFRNIISNLIENAIKYSPNTPIITISTTNYSEGILISVADQGIGISKKHQDRIFDRFYRVESGDVQNTQGFGLGLYYVRRVVEAHGGFIKVQSEEGVGSQFEMYFPAL